MIGGSEERGGRKGVKRRGAGGRKSGISGSSPAVAGGIGGLTLGEIGGAGVNGANNDTCRRDGTVQEAMMAI